MRFARLDFIRYGHFTDRTLELPRRDVDLHVIVGANEAGKTTAQAAIDDFLFGFPRQTTRDFLHPAATLRIGALVDANGEQLAARRRKGNKDTLLDGDENPISEALLGACLGVERDFFRTMFSLGHERLREGGKRILLDANDDVGRMIFEAGAGLTGLRDLQAALEREAEDLFAPRAAANRRFYVAKARLDDAEKRLRSATTSAREWNEAKKAFDEVRARKEELAREVKTRKTERVRLERIRRVLPILAELRRTDEELVALGDVAALPPDAERELADAETALLSALTQRRAIDEELATIERELAPLVVDEALLAHEKEIDKLRDLRASVGKSRTDLERRRAELNQHRARLATLLSEIGEAPRDLAEIGALLPSRPKVATIERLLDERGARVTGHAKAVEGHASLVAERERLAGELTAAGEPLDPKPLARVIAAVRDRGDLATEAKRARTEIERLERYVRVRAAARILSWAVERHRRERQAPLLRRASEIFRGLTRDSFASLAVDLDDQDRASLVGVRSDCVHVPVDGMSDGTVDQLYLALRLAAVEAHVGGERPLPFIADDLFVNFDDERAAAGFRMLGELAKRTQVLFFTHHAHLADIARHALGGDTPVHQLSPERCASDGTP